jgi:hypothetical protein
MKQKLVKHGEDWAVVIDDSMLDLLKIGPETALDIRTDGKQLLIGPADPARAAKFKEALADLNREFAPALRRLAE